ncbi:MAG TPA: hypothetical protein VFV99_28115 [Kofleriaceae bacterium]|nr:hypothetical protein [Kofleriaceae bacterium]
MDERRARMTRVIDGSDPVAGSLVRDYLNGAPALAARLEESGIPVVVFVSNDRWDDSPDYFKQMQRGLDAAIAKHGRAVYVARTTAGYLLKAARRLADRRVFPPLACAHGVFVGYIAVGEGGLVFFDATGKDWGVRPPSTLFEAAISGMMAPYR